jgi:hypothetical protein
VSFLQCIAWSSNVCFYKLGGGYADEIPEGLGPLRHGEYARALGYGEPTGIELFGESDGLVPSPQWKRINLAENWSTGDTYISSVGQGFVVATPLQVLMSAVTIANSGVQMKPTLIHQIVDSAGNVVQPFTPTVHWDITKDNLIAVYDCSEGFCVPTGETKNVPGGGRQGARGDEARRHFAPRDAQPPRVVCKLPHRRCWQDWHGRVLRRRGPQPGPLQVWSLAHACLDGGICALR